MIGSLQLQRHIRLEVQSGGAIPYFLPHYFLPLCEFENGWGPTTPILKLVLHFNLSLECLVLFFPLSPAAATV